MLKDRFSIMFYPTFILFSEKYQYEYTEKVFDYQSFKRFIIEGYRENEKEEIPLTPQKWRNFIKYIGKILRRAYEVICVDGMKGLFVIGVLVFLVTALYLAQGFFKRKLDDYMKMKKIEVFSKKEKKK